MQSMHRPLIAFSVSWAVLARGAQQGTQREQQQLRGGDDAQAFLTVDRGLPALEEAVAYTKRYRPYDDKVSDEFLADNAKYALLAAELPYAKQVDRELFMSQVLPYAHFDEARQPWRAQFYQTLLPHVQSKATLREAADALWAAWPTAFGKQLHFKGNMTPQIMAPLDTLREGHASCTGFGIFVANCYRSVGIPSRVVGVGEWNTESGGNHNWIEVWNGTGWMYIDDSPEQSAVPTWNSAWFSDQAKLAESAPLKHAVLSPLWGPLANTEYPLGWWSEEPAESRGVKSVPAIDVTARYAPLAKVNGLYLNIPAVRLTTIIAIVFVLGGLLLAAKRCCEDNPQFKRS
eukprot:TRINITY_DN58888_c0_g1_i1.p1 TRINITY_DN58888_c0_g1~~TRINITY_DN58888_c0_g1_i1.p1  ORF type:complete len:346 (+),score=83.84 TRINITY_DN58888_c0_g1_i1:46-1083(+)